MKNDILYNLEILLNKSLTQLKEATIEKIISNCLNETNKGYLSMGINHYLDDVEAKELNELKKNLELKKTFQQAIEFKFDENQLITNFKSELQKAFADIKLNVHTEQKKLKSQVIFIEYHYLPNASISGFGKGNFPILKKPEYLESYPMDEMFSSIEKIDYSLAWKNLISLNDIVEQYEIEDCIFESEIYQALKNAYIFKTYILLHKAFDELGTKLLDGIEIIKPLMVYGCEHDCEVINIYVFE